MREVVNIRQLQRLVHQSFHEVALKYDIDVDLVAEIIEDYSRTMEKQIEGRIIISEN